MLNLDTIKAKKAEILQQLSDAVKANDPEAFAQAFNDLADNLQQAVMAEARGLMASADNTILAGRGVRQLTNEENKYYQRLTDALRSSNPKQALTSMDDVLPKTIIDTIFEDIMDEHPLLDMIDFQNTGALTEILVSTTSGVAAWGELTAAITAELGAAFDLISLGKMKLSAFLPVAKAMLDLGPVWLDRYVRAILVEALSTQLEAGGVDGDGDEKPIGMTRALSGAVDGVYPRKAATVITKFDPATMGALLNTISTGPNSKRRAVPKLLLVVNPADYYTKVFPATTILQPDGTYRNNVFPYPTDVVISPAVPSNHAVLGLASKYFMGLGTSKGGKLEFSDEYKFLEDQRVYLIKLYGNGKPLDANAFAYLDISGLVANNSIVSVANLDEIVVPAYPDARLASLAIGSLTLDPTFNKSVMIYEAATTNATNTITAVAKDGEATIAIKLNGAAHTNGAAATWNTGANTVEVTVTVGGESEVYTVAVTKS